jgi:hypothetical protein
MSFTPILTEQDQEALLGKEAKVLSDQFFPEAIGIVEAVRGYGSFQAIEIRTYKNQPGPRVRVAFEGGWSLTEAEAEGGEA